MRPVLVLLLSLSSAFAAAPAFEPNRGQFSPDLTFVSRSGPVSVAVSRNGLLFRRRDAALRVRFSHAVRTHCAPASPAVATTNYLAADPPVAGVPVYTAISCRDLYPGIDWNLHGNSGQLEHDWMLAPHADLSAIDLRIEGPRRIHLTADGELRLESFAFTVTWKKPVAWQEVDGRRRAVPISYSLDRTRLTLRAGAYDRTRPLVVDPVLDFVYVLGGNADDRGFAVGVDGAGFVYIAGFTQSTDFQTTPGAPVPSPTPNSGSGNPQVYVRKLSPDGSKLLYSTYLGIGTLSSHPIGMRVDSAGNVYLAADSFNVSLPTAGTPIDPAGTVSVFKIAPTGDRLVYATRVIPAQSYGEPVALAIDLAGNAYVASGSFSISVSKIDPAGQKQLYLFTSKASGYFGGVGGIAVASDGSAYIAGNTASGGLVTTPGAWRATTGNTQNNHGYLIRLKPDGSGPLFSTYVGGDFLDEVFDVNLDSSGAPVVVGDTFRDPRFAGLQGTPLGLSAASANNAFVVKIKADGSGPIWSVLLPCPKLTAVALDPAGNIYTAGPTATGAVAAKLNPDGNSLLYFSNIAADPNTPLSVNARTVGISSDSAGAAYLAGSSVTLNVPELRAITGMQPNAWFAKVDPNPPQSDLALTVTADTASVFPGQHITYTINIANNGQAPAEDVVVTTFGASVLACGLSGGGQCSAGNMSFASLPPGQTATATILSAIGSGHTNGDKLTFQVSASTLSSDVNQDNNFAAVSVTLNFISVSINSAPNLRCTFRYNGSPAVFQSGTSFSVAPNSAIVIEWPSPQLNGLGTTSVFQHWSDGSTANPRTFTLGSDNVNLVAIFTEVNTPLVSTGGVSNAGSYANDGVSPGEIVTVFGFNLGGFLTSGQAANGQLPTRIGNTRVLFDGVAAPLVYAGANAISAIVPYDVAGKTSTSMVVQVGDTSAPPTQLTVLDTVPGLFTANSSGAGQAAALNQDGTINSPSNPAHPGDVIVLYGTGEGLVTPRPPNGAIVASPAPAPLAPVTATIGGISAPVLYAGGAPVEPAGVIQINLRIPPGLPANHHTAVIWSAGSKSSQSGVTIAIE
jgi:uncharacterized protein (TIGR03437 family)